MFESVTGEQSQPLSIVEKFEAIFEHRRLRLFRVIDWTIIMPLSVAIMLWIFLTTDAPQFLGVPAVIVLYGLLFVPAMWIYDQRFPPATERDFLDYLGLLGAHVKHAWGPLVVALLGTLFTF